VVPIQRLTHVRRRQAQFEELKFVSHFGGYHATGLDAQM
jgi:hypothetical protein